ncbi:MAG: hypothetical protein NTX64_14850 [Elusimicrobia bacterium]|nr:hypothetical protein [Elusimicrobiota bacterium]
MSRLRVLVVAASAGLAACASSKAQPEGRAGWMSAYAPASFLAAFDPAGRAGTRIQLVAAFSAIEDRILDLPDEYQSGWLRVAVSDPADSRSRSMEVVVPKSDESFLAALAPGERLDLFALRTVHPDSFGIGPAVLLRVEKLGRHAAGGAARD